MEIQNVIAICAVIVPIVALSYKSKKDQERAQRAFELKMIELLEKEIKIVEEKLDIKIDHIEHMITGDVKQLENKLDDLRDLVQHSHDKLIDLLSQVITK